jgi:hypothetical protein
MIKLSVSPVSAARAGGRRSPTIGARLTAQSHDAPHASGQQHGQPRPRPSGPAARVTSKSRLPRASTAAHHQREQGSQE